MITRQEIFEGLYGAWRLFLRDRGAIALFDDSVAGFWKSFAAAAVVLPIYIVLTAFGPIAVETSRNILAVLLIHAEFYVIGWTLWPLIMGHLTPAFDRDEKYVLYIVAYNWSSGVQAGLLLVFFLVGVMLPLSPGFATLLDIAILIVLLMYHMFVLRSTLDLPAAPAFALVVVEFIVSQMVLGIRNGVLA